MKWLLLTSCAFLSVLLPNCHPRGPRKPAQPPMSQSDIKEFQTKTFATIDMKRIMKSLLNVFQDDGYMVKNVNAELGFLQATKDVDVLKTGDAIALTFIVGKDARYSRIVIIDCSCNVREFKDGTQVRINFQSKTINNKGEISVMKQVTDQRFYQEFFSKLENAISL